MPLYTTSALAGTVLSIVFGIWIFFSSRGTKKYNLSFFILYLNLAAWLGFYFISQVSVTEYNAKIWLYVSQIFMNFIPVTLYYWSLILAQKTKFAILSVFAVISLVFSVLLITPLLAHEPGMVGQYYSFKAGLLLPLLAIYYFVAFAFSMRVLLDFFYKMPQNRRGSVRYLIIATVSFFLVIVNFITWYHVRLGPVGNLLVILFIFNAWYFSIKKEVVTRKMDLFLVQILGVLMLVMSVNHLLNSDTPQGYGENILLLFSAIFILGFLFYNYETTVVLKEDLKTTKKEITKSNEEIKKLDQAKSEFISIASHQLRTPLTAIKGFISLILEGSYGEINPKVRDALNKMYLSNERLVKLVEDLLDITRIEAGNVEYHFGQTQVEGLLKKLYDSYYIMAEKKGLDFNLNLPENPLPKVIMDVEKIEEVIANMLDNAINYTSEGNISLSLQQNNDKLRIMVEDTGIGIAQDNLPYLFNKFARGDNVDRVSVKGVGLGLYVAKNLVTAHRGKIWAESDGVGKGSKFIVELPMI